MGLFKKEIEQNLTKQEKALLESKFNDKATPCKALKDSVISSAFNAKINVLIINDIAVSLKELKINDIYQLSDKSSKFKVLSEKDTYYEFSVNIDGKILVLNCYQYNIQLL